MTYGLVSVQGWPLNIGINNKDKQRTATGEGRGEGVPVYIPKNELSLHKT